MARDELDLGVRVTEIWSTRGTRNFEQITGIAKWPDGTIWVADLLAEEVSEISPAGEVECCVVEGYYAELGYLSVFPDGSGAVVFGLSGPARFFGANRTLSHETELPGIWARGVTAVPEHGGFVVAGGASRSDMRPFAVHHFDQTGEHVASWHPAVASQSRKGRALSGGPVSFTSAGDLLVGDLAPFRITRYTDFQIEDPVLVVEDHSVIPPEELERAVSPDDPGETYQPRWNRSVYVGEMADGNLLSVVHVYPDGIQMPVESIALVIAPEGEILARTWFARQYRIWAQADGQFLASYTDHQTLREIVALIDVRLEH